MPVLVVCATHLYSLLIQAKQQILSGCLPCTSGDAAKLAALIMIIDSLAMAGHEGGKERSLGAISEDVCEAVEAKALKNSQSHLKLIGRRISKLALPLRNTDSNPDYSVSKLKVYLPPGIVSTIALDFGCPVL